MDKKENNIITEIPIVDLVPNYTFWNLQDYAYNEALKKNKKLYKDFNENLYNFTYDFVCKVNITPIKK